MGGSQKLLEDMFFFSSEMHQAGIARIDIPLWALFLGESLMKAHDPSADLSRKKRSLVCLSSSFGLVPQSSFDSRPGLSDSTRVTQPWSGLVPGLGIIPFIKKSVRLFRQGFKPAQETNYHILVSLTFQLCLIPFSQKNTHLNSSILQSTESKSKIHTLHDIIQEQVCYRAQILHPSSRTHGWTPF